MADVRIGEVTSDVTVTDASSFLSPEMLERIVQAVVARLEGKRRDDEQRDRERSFGGDR